MFQLGTLQRLCAAARVCCVLCGPLYVAHKFSEAQSRQQAGRNTNHPGMRRGDFCSGLPSSGRARSVSYDHTPCVCAASMMVCNRMPASRALYTPRSPCTNTNITVGAPKNSKFFRICFSFLSLSCLPMPSSPYRPAPHSLRLCCSAAGYLASTLRAAAHTHRQW